MSEISPEPTTFAEVNERLARIADEVHDKDLSLEKSLDLYEEAVRLSNDALLLVQKPIFSPEESATLSELRSGDPLEEAAVPGDAPSVASSAPNEPGTDLQVDPGADPGSEESSVAEGSPRTESGR